MNYQGLSILNGIINLVVVCFAATNHSSVSMQFTVLCSIYVLVQWRENRLEFSAISEKSRAENFLFSYEDYRFVNANSYIRFGVFCLHLQCWRHD
jgi:hypothetical protein